jgi:XTP/dITP diphosphohydrolase
LSAHPAHRLFVATGNPGKLAEFRALIAEAALDVDVVGLADLPAPYVEPVEDGASFAENALIKARAGVAASGLPTLADDSGICVDALNGMPGIFSARWSGSHGADEPNRRLLLDQLRDVPDDRRTAHFRAVLALALPGGGVGVAEARWAGRIARTEQGEHGFGYDPIFLPDDPEATGPDGRRLSSAELDPAVKDRISHRGQAFVAALPMLRAAFPS